MDNFHHFRDTTHPRGNGALSKRASRQNGGMTEMFRTDEFVYNHYLSVPFHPLVPDPEEGIGDVALDGNLIVQGGTT